MSDALDDNREGDCYIEGVRDLAKMGHVSTAIAGVLNDCANDMEALRSQVSELRADLEALMTAARNVCDGQASPASVRTLRATLSRIKEDTDNGRTGEDHSRRDRE